MSLVSLGLWITKILVLFCCTVTGFVKVPFERTIIREYDCASYVVDLDVEWLRFKVNDALSLVCPKHLAMVVLELVHRSQECRITFRYFPNREKVLEHESCGPVTERIVVEAPEFAFGTQWGCKQTTVPMTITKYYQVGVAVPKVFTMAQAAQFIGVCRVQSLHYEKMVPIHCSINVFGGYDWEPVNPNACATPELENPTMEMLDRLKTSPIYCAIRMFLLYGFLKRHPSPIEQRLQQVSTRLISECWDAQESWVLENMRIDYYQLLDAVYQNLYSAVARKMSTKTLVQILKSCQISLAQSFGQYFGANESVYQRTHFFHVFIVPEPKQGRNSEGHIVQCGEQFTVHLLEVTYPVRIVCNKRLTYMERLTIFSMYLTTGFITVWPQNDEEFLVRIVNHPSPFQQPGNYACARYPLFETMTENNTSADCYEVYTQTADITCECTKPGLYALLQDRPPTGPTTADYINKLNNPTTKLMHALVLLSLSISVLVHFYVRWSADGMDLYAGESRNSHRLKPFFDITIQEHLLLITKIALQLSSIMLTREEDCEVLGTIFHASNLMLGLLNLLASVNVFAAARAHRLHSLVIEICIVGYVIVALIGAGFYIAFPTEYFSINCLPTKMVFTMVYPMLVLSSIPCLFLVAYCFTSPYRNLDEWLGTAGHAMLNIFIWSGLINMPTPRNYVSRAVIRLTMMNLVQGVYVSVFHMFLKFSMYGFYWRSCKRAFTRTVSVKRAGIKLAKEVSSHLHCQAKSQGKSKTTQKYASEPCYMVNENRHGDS